MIIERFATSGSVNLHTINWGGGGTPILLLAGLGNTAHIFRGLAPRLTANFRVVGLTRRGHGRSDRPAEGYDLNTLVEDIRVFLDTMGFESVILAGSSFAGLEMPLFARRYPQRVESIVFLDALFPKLDPEPDFSGDPVWAEAPSEPDPLDLVSQETYLNFQKRLRPDLARIWCTAIEADLLEQVAVGANGRLQYHHDNDLMNRIAAQNWPSRNPQYETITAPMLAIVPDGEFHHGLPPDAPPELRQAADRYWLDNIRPWIRHRTVLFRQAAPGARIVELDAPNHLIFIAKEDETVSAIQDFVN